VERGGQRLKKGFKKIVYELNCISNEECDTHKKLSS